MQLDILYEDNHLIAVNKPAGVLSQGDKTGDESLTDHVKKYLREKYQKPGEAYVGLIHRIDRPVSGLVLLAKTSKALSRMNEQFKTREVQKTYWAIVATQPQPTEAKLTHWLKKNEKQNKSYGTLKETNDSLRCELSYKLLASGDRYFLLEINPATGRHHQIRVQLSSIGCVIKGDLKYGAKRSNEDTSISLHARQLTFIHPIKLEPITILAPAPKDKLWQYFEQTQSSKNC